MSTLIAPEQLRPGHRLFDVRMGPDAADAYRSAHLEGAHFVDVDADLAAHPDDPRHGGRHPLPELRAWCSKLGHFGVTPDTEVVVYDDASGAKAAARMWWMLRAVGHERVWVLDGGLQAAVAAGLPLSADVPTRMPVAPYPAPESTGAKRRRLGGAGGDSSTDLAWAMPTITVEALEHQLASGTCLIDVRARARFEGREEPFDPPGGHIPGAISVPLGENLDPQGRFKSKDELRALYEAALGDAAIEDVVVSCGSGITACHTLLALEHAGLSGARLYVGSYSEWSRSGRPVERA